MRQQVLHVYVKTEDEVKALRAEVARLGVEVEAQRERANRAEYMYRCESVINQELVDLLKAHGIGFRKALSARPW